LPKFAWLCIAIDLLDSDPDPIAKKKLTKILSVITIKLKAPFQVERWYLLFVAVYEPFTVLTPW
jgi:hypothetical protein